MTDHPTPSPAALAAADAICKRHGMLPGGYMRDSLAEALEDYARHHWNITKPLDAAPVCRGCGGPHPFDTSIDSVMWNQVIRAAGLPDYLCTTCIVKAFVLAGHGFNADLWGAGLDGAQIHVSVAILPHAYLDRQPITEAERDAIAKDGP